VSYLWDLSFRRDDGAKLETRNMKPWAWNPELETLNLKPETRNRVRDSSGYPFLDSVLNLPHQQSDLGSYWWGL